MSRFHSHFGGVVTHMETQRVFEIQGISSTQPGWVAVFCDDSMLPIYTPIIQWATCHCINDPSAATLSVGALVPGANGLELANNASNYMGAYYLPEEYDKLVRGLPQWSSKQIKERILTLSSNG